MFDVSDTGFSGVSEVGEVTVKVQVSEQIYSKFSPYTLWAPYLVGVRLKERSRLGNFGLFYTRRFYITTLSVSNL